MSILDGKSIGLVKIHDNHAELWITGGVVKIYSLRDVMLISQCMRNNKPYGKEVVNEAVRNLCIEEGIV